MGRFAGRAGLAFAFVAALSTQAAPVKSCPGAEVVSAESSAEFGREFPFSPQAGRIDVTPSAPKGDIPTGETAVRAVSFGPVLNSSSSREVETEFNCAGDGLVLVATIITDPGAPIKKDVQWRPKIEMKLLLRRPSVPFQTTWRLRLPDGTPLHQGRTPWASEQEYPFEVRATLTSVPK